METKENVNAILDIKKETPEWMQEMDTQTLSQMRQREAYERLDPPKTEESNQELEAKFTSGLKEAKINGAKQEQIVNLSETYNKFDGAMDKKNATLAKKEMIDTLKNANKQVKNTPDIDVDAVYADASMRSESIFRSGLVKDFESPTRDAAPDPSASANAATKKEAAIKAHSASVMKSAEIFKTKDNVEEQEVSFSAKEMNAFHKLTNTVGRMFNTPQEQINELNQSFADLANNSMSRPFGIPVAEIASITNGAALNALQQKNQQFDAQKNEQLQDYFQKYIQKIVDFTGRTLKPGENKTLNIGNDKTGHVSLMISKDQTGKIGANIKGDGELFAVFNKFAQGAGTKGIGEVAAKAGSAIVPGLREAKIIMDIAKKITDAFKKQMQQIQQAMERQGR